MTNVFTFPGVTPPEERKAEVSLADWFSTIVSRAEGVSIEHAIVILMSEDGEQIVYSKNDVRKDQFLGMLHIAQEQGLYGQVAP